MPGTVLVREVLWRVSSILHDTNPQFLRFPEAELVQWLDDAHLAITSLLPAACSRIDAIKLRPGTRQSIELIAAADCKPGDGSTPTAPVRGTQVLDVIRNMGANGATPGRSIRLIADGREVLDAQNPDWHSQTGERVGQWMFDPRTPRHFYVSPGAPSTGAVWAEVAYVAEPQKIPAGGAVGAPVHHYSGSSTAVIQVRDEHLADLVNYVCARALMKNAQFAGNDQKAALFTGMFTGSLNAKVVALTGNNPNLQRLPLAPQPLAAAS